MKVMVRICKKSALKGRKCIWKNMQGKMINDKKQMIKGNVSMYTIKGCLHQIKYM